MKQSLETDKVCIEKILKYIDGIQDCFTRLDINSYLDFEKDGIAQLAVTQSITNLHEAKKQIQQVTLDNIAEFDKIKLAVARNIASHDYESVNFETIYRICSRLLSQRTREVLQNEYDKLKQQAD